MKNLDGNHPQTVINFVQNLKFLMNQTGMKKTELAEKCGLSSRYIGYLLDFERYPTIEAAEQIAAAFKLNGWLIIMPNLEKHLINSNMLEDLINEFSLASKPTQDYINEILHRERQVKQ